MFSAIWNRLPGAWWLRLVLMLVMIAIVAWLVWTFVYPAIGDLLLPEVEAPLIQ
ncbi:MAG: hypothetical protein WBA28_06605 [Microbacteriaceae bacterium]